MSIRTERLSRLIQREIADVLNQQFREDSPAMATVTGTRVTGDLSIAYVYVSFMGASSQERQVSFRHLQELAPQIRMELASRIRHQVRAIPELRFQLDESLEHAENIEKLLERARLERERRAPSSEEDSEE